MSLISLILVLAVVGVIMALIYTYVPSPYSTILLVVCGLVLVIMVLAITGVADLRTVRVGPP